MIFTIAPLVQEAKTTRRWLATLALFTAALIAVLGIFGAGMTWAGAAVAAQVTAPRAREIIASVALTALGVVSLVIALGELGLSRPLLPRITAVPGGGSLARRTVTIALTFGATMAIFSPLSAYALVIGWVAAQRSAWLGAVTLMAYGVGLMVPLAIAGTMAAGRGDEAALTERTQQRLRIVSGAALALAGGFMLSMWTLRATWALFL